MEKKTRQKLYKQMLVGQKKNKKRKRLGQPQSEESKERQKSASLRREMLELRGISEIVFPVL